MRVFLLSAAGIFVLDQATKAWVLFGLGLEERGAIDVLPPFLNLRMAWNRGINFGLLSGHSEALRWGLIGLAVAISLLVTWWVWQGRGSRLFQIAGGVLVGGALGNVVDRVAYGAVADFLNMSCCGIENPYVFNVADIAIVAGAVGLALFPGRPPHGAAGAGARSGAGTPDAVFGREGKRKDRR
ncbi:signal peptidase II [Hasllibacter halocynthiae]|uniref:Lipoprotein signal peptidase n=1 Tax=Hasllibacter halocynthiae TaxID=595589 RepID=A0A2T0X3Q0_9RHOB|nr:signal peptidase II [Hasllibacter halocynthiae]PRY93561.1 signal peptidase II [Hasllibacter halocynthiae]